MDNSIISIDHIQLPIEQGACKVKWRLGRVGNSRREYSEVAERRSKLTVLC
jgi:hypothetical protein